MGSNVPVTQATMQEAVLPERVQEALGELRVIQRVAASNRSFRTELPQLQWTTSSDPRSRPAGCRYVTNAITRLARTTRLFLVKAATRPTRPYRLSDCREPAPASAGTTARPPTGGGVAAHSRRDRLGTEPAAPEP